MRRRKRAALWPVQISNSISQFQANPRFFFTQDNPYQPSATMSLLCWCYSVFLSFQPNKNRFSPILLLMKEATGLLRFKKKNLVLVNPGKQYRIQNRKNGITSHIYFHLDPKRTQRNITMEILQVYKEGPKKDTCTVQR